MKEFIVENELLKRSKQGWRLMVPFLLGIIILVVGISLALVYYNNMFVSVELALKFWIAVAVIVIGLMLVLITMLISFLSHDESIE